MKKILAILVALLCCCTSVFANEQEAVSSFTAMINKIQAGIERDFSVLLWADFYPLDSKAILHHLPFSCIFFFL